MPLLNELYNQNKRLGFTIIGVNVEEQTKNARNFLRKYPVKFPMVMDPQNQVSKLYKIKAMPTTVVLDRDGKVRFVHHGYKPGDEIAYNKMVMQLIRE